MDHFERNVRFLLEKFLLPRIFYGGRNDRDGKCSLSDLENSNVTYIQTDVNGLSFLIYDVIVPLFNNLFLSRSNFDVSSYAFYCILQQYFSVSY